MSYEKVVYKNHSSMTAINQAVQLQIGAKIKQKKINQKTKKKYCQLNLSQQDIIGRQKLKSNKINESAKYIIKLHQTHRKYHSAIII